MFKIAPAVASLAFLSITAIGQTPEELARLRERLNLPPATMILSSAFSKLPAEIPLKIYLGTGRDEKVNQRFLKWIDKWNQGAGRQFGILQVVPDLLQADIVIARYEGDVSIEQRNSIGTVPVIDLKTTSTSNKPTYSSRTYIYRPLYSYLITRTPDTLAIVYRHVDRYNTKDRADPDGSLLDELKKKMKLR